MSINISVPSNNDTPELKPRITVVGVGGAGCNAVNNMIASELEGVDFVVANTDAQALASSRSERRIQMGISITHGLGAGSRPDIGRAAAEETLDEILEALKGFNMVFITAGMGGGTGTGAAPVIARTAREEGILTVGVVTKPFEFEGAHRMRLAVAGIEELEQFVDALIIIPNQNLFRIANEKTTFADAFSMADDVLYSGVRGVTDLMVMPGLINLDFTDIRSVMSEMGKAMMGTGEAEGERRALDAAEAAISNPLLDDASMQGAKGLLINITGGCDMTLFEVDEAATRIRDEVDEEACIIFGSTFDKSMEGKLRVSVVATGIESKIGTLPIPTMINLADQGGPPEDMARIEGNTGQAGKAHPVPTAAGDAIASVLKNPEPVDTEQDTATTAEETGGEKLPANEIPEGKNRRESATTKPLGKAPPATPGIKATEPFIPPSPAKPAVEGGAREADPFAAAAMMNSPKERENKADPEPIGMERIGTERIGTERIGKKGLSLFERVTGTGLAAKAKKAANIAKSKYNSSAVAAKRGMAIKPAQEADRGKQGGPGLQDRLATSSAEEDLLEIPTFLRRQAN